MISSNYVGKAVATIGAVVPASKIFPAIGLDFDSFIVYGRASLNTMSLDTLFQGDSALTEASLSPADSYNLDLKMDDGVPNTGLMFIVPGNVVPAGSLCCRQFTCIRI